MTLASQNASSDVKMNENFNEGQSLVMWITAPARVTSPTASRALPEPDHPCSPCKTGHTAVKSA
ncbi:hypothetical protein E2C01_036325 [Portunus trituberculatus]|uniref:Uncharacterized protein n=1 Tax=Portunus trituberculatus TaxID=210409 RepID=A0A5B7FC59_PORTR|nr:hypothetical protein [Portunus trituberculatus]